MLMKNSPHFSYCSLKCVFPLSCWCGNTIDIDIDIHAVKTKFLRLVFHDPTDRFISGDY